MQPTITCIQPTIQYLNLSLCLCDYQSGPINELLNRLSKERWLLIGDSFRRIYVKIDRYIQGVRYFMMIW